MDESLYAKLVQFPVHLSGGPVWEGDWSRLIPSPTTNDEGSLDLFAADIRLHGAERRKS